MAGGESVDGYVCGRRKPDQYRRYVDLVAAGVGVEEAARRVGVHRRTAYRWNNAVPERRAAGRPGWVGAWQAGRSSGARRARGRYLDLDERILIADASRQQIGVREIARQLGRAASTVSRELRRHRWQRAGSDGSQVSHFYYGPHGADRAAQRARRRPKPAVLVVDRELGAHVQARLDQRWSPRQIAMTLPRVFPDQPARHVCHETIYQALYVQARGGLRREVAAALRHGRAHRRPRDQQQRQARRPRFVDPMVMISERPAEAEDRAVPGHWEGDLIIGRDGGSALITLVERSTRYLLLGPLRHGRDADAAETQLRQLVATLPAQLWRSLTWDQGSELACHQRFRTATGISVYFCDPASPWQRGSNENTNGLLRQYFPKGTDLSGHSDDHLAAVADQLNRRPRETLDWDSPAERLATLLELHRCVDH